MKTIKIKYLITLILLFTGSALFPQAKSGQTYYTNYISIDYTKGSVTGESISIDQKTLTSDLYSIDDINKISFLSDSMVSISNKKQSDLQLNINKISEIRIKNGSKTGKGIILGAIAGFGIGALIGKTTEAKDENISKEYFYISPLGAGGIIGLIIGAITGGIIGGNTTDYETYDLDEYNLAKKKMLERWLEIHQVRNGKNF